MEWFAYRGSLLLVAGYSTVAPEAAHLFSVGGHEPG